MQPSVNFNPLLPVAVLFGRKANFSEELFEEKSIYDPFSQKTEPVLMGGSSTGSPVGTKCLRHHTTQKKKGSNVLTKTDNKNEIDDTKYKD